MKVIIAEADGYLGRNISLLLLQKGHKVIAVANDKKQIEFYHPNLIVIEKESIHHNEIKLKADSAINLPPGEQKSKFAGQKKEDNGKFDFNVIAEKSNVNHLLYLTTILDKNFIETKPGKASHGLKKGNFATTFLHSDFIIGSGSPSFEIGRNVVEKIPVMILPYWVKAPCTYTGIDELLEKIEKICGNKDYFNNSYTLGNKNIINPADMLKTYAKTRGMLRLNIPFPFPAVRLYSYLLSIIALIPIDQALNLIKELKYRYKNRKFQKQPDIVTHLSYSESLKLALGFTSALKITKKTPGPTSIAVDSYAFEGYNNTPVHGCFNTATEKNIPVKKIDDLLKRINSIGYNNKLFYTNWLWHFRGWTNWIIKAKIEKSDKFEINKDDKIDFWKVHIADNENYHFLLYADLFLPGEGWLEFRIIDGKKGYKLKLSLIFRPLGFSGRFYWLTTKLLNYIVLKKIKHSLLSNLLQQKYDYKK